MALSVRLHADDLGRSSTINAGIFESVDRGSVAGVSVLANGSALGEAARWLAERPDLSVRLHFNIFEGRACCADDGRRLTRPDGMFNRTFAGLWLAHLLGRRRAKEAIEQAVRDELYAQHAMLAAQLPGRIRAIDCHYHAQYLPFVAKIIAHEAQGLGIREIRIGSEPLYAPVGFMLRHPVSFVINAVKWCVIAALGAAARTHAEAAGLETPDRIAGVLTSGSVDGETVLAAAAACREHAHSLEVVIHPGGASPSEAYLFNGAPSHFPQFYFAAGRARERAFATDPQTRETISAACGEGRGTFAENLSAHLSQLMRFGISGAIAAFVHLFSMYLLTEAFGVWYSLSGALGFLIAYGVSFSLQKFWTFKDTSRRTGAQAGWYFLIALCALGANVAGVYLLVEFAHLWYVAAQFIVLVLVSVATFFLYRRLFSPNAATAFAV